jgi:hypothetical protein
MAGTHKLIGSVTVGSGGSSSIEFTSIPATYADLILKDNSYLYFFIIKSKKSNQMNTGGRNTNNSKK